MSNLKLTCTSNP